MRSCTGARAGAQMGSATFLQGIHACMHDGGLYLGEQPGCVHPHLRQKALARRRNVSSSFDRIISTTSL